MQMGMDPVDPQSPNRSFRHLLGSLPSLRMRRAPTWILWMLLLLMVPSREQALLLTVYRVIGILLMRQATLCRTRWAAFPSVTRKRTRKIPIMAAWTTVSVRRIGLVSLPTFSGRLLWINSVAARSPQRDPSLALPLITFIT